MQRMRKGKGKGRGNEGIRLDIPIITWCYVLGEVVGFRIGGEGGKGQEYGVVPSMDTRGFACILRRGRGKFITLTIGAPSCHKSYAHPVGSLMRMKCE